MQSATIDPTLDLCTRYLQLVDQWQSEMRSLLDTYEHDQHQKSSSRRFDLESHKDLCIKLSTEHSTKCDT